MRELIVLDREVVGREAMLLRLQQAGFVIDRPCEVEAITQNGEPARRYTQEEA